MHEDTDKLDGAPVKGKNFLTGFILLYRSIRSHWIWQDPAKLKWWLDMLMECNHSWQKVNIGFQMYECDRGESIRSLENWAIRWRVDRSTVRRFFKLLQEDGMIKLENLQKTTKLTICNYSLYNDIKPSKQRQGNADATLKQLQDDSETTQTKNVLINDLNKGNNEEIRLPWESERFANSWNEYKQHRKSLKKPITTVLQENKALKKLCEKTEGSEEKAIELIDNSIANGWIGIILQNNNSKLNGKPQPKNVTTGEFGNL